MKNKLKALFAYFRGLKQEELFFNITFVYNTIRGMKRKRKRVSKYYTNHKIDKVGIQN